MDEAQKRYFLSFPLFIGIFPFIVNGYVNPWLINNPVHYWLFEISTWVLLPILVYYLAKKYTGLTLSDYGIHSVIFKDRKIEQLVVFSLVFSIFSYYLYTYIYNYFSYVVSSEPYFTYSTTIPDNAVYRSIVVLYYALTAGIVEEFYYRGFLYKISTLFSKPSIVFLVISPFLFSLVHWESGAANIYTTYVVGLIFAIAYLRLKNLWPLIAGHTFTDYVYFSTNYS